jgi:hypothetical protein
LPHASRGFLYFYSFGDERRVFQDFLFLLTMEGFYDKSACLFHFHALFPGGQPASQAFKAPGQRGFSRDRLQEEVCRD